jgi:hypothetical protein
VLCGSLLAAVAVLAGCGNKEEVVTEAGTEGIYVDVGGLKYQIQISRVLNPADVEDRDYLHGLPEGVTPADDETWFAIFLRVQNTTEDQTLAAASEFEIVDTQENVYRPVPIEESNPYAFRPVDLPPGGLIPDAGSAATYNPTQGALLLFKVKNESLGNRPLEFRISSPEGEGEAVIDIDV